jgi:acyl-homoserine lactone acylase PvdQ
VCGCTRTTRACLSSTATPPTTSGFGAGYAAGQQRLFLADAVRRTGRGTLAELVGPAAVPADVQARTLTYSQKDYDEMFAALPRESRESIEGYAAGLDAWIAHVRTTPADLPVEYALLSSLPERWTVTDTLAAGVLITRTVASSGGTEHVETGCCAPCRRPSGPRAAWARSPTCAGSRTTRPR